MGICVWFSDCTLNVMVLPRMWLSLVTMACFLTGRCKGNTLMLLEDLDITGCKGALHDFQHCPNGCSECVCAAPFCLVWDRSFYIQELVPWNSEFTVARAGSLRSHHPGISRVSLQFSLNQMLYDFCQQLVFISFHQSLIQQSYSNKVMCVSQIILILELEKYMYRIRENAYAELEGTYQDHHVQLLALHRTL